MIPEDFEKESEKVFIESQIQLLKSDIGLIKSKNKKYFKYIKESEV